MEHGEVGLLVDTDAHDTLCGSAWTVQQARHCQEAGKLWTQKRMSQSRRSTGVGGEAQADFEVVLAAGLQDSSGNLYEETFRAPCLENSGVSGLLGLQSLARNDALIRCRTGDLWFLGGDGVEITPSPGTRHFQMRKSRSGHWMLPISRFSSQGTRSGGISMSSAPQMAAASSSSTS